MILRSLGKFGKPVIVLAIVLLSVGSTALPGAASNSTEASTTTWVQMLSPNGRESVNFLWSVSCTGPSFCVAVGYSRNKTSSKYSELSEIWNGSAWSVVPLAPLGTEGVLFGVSCTSSSFCIAVGRVSGLTYQIQTQIEMWNGTSWSLSGTSVEGGLTGVSCESNAFCKAIGFNDATGPLIESWDGSSWTTDTDPSDVDDVMFSSISCGSAMSCAAVGSGPNGVVAASWNGASWTVVQNGTLGDAPSGYLTGVSCVTTSFCAAVGANQYKKKGVELVKFETVAEIWNGADWVVTPSPNPDKGTDSFYAVSCVSPTDCLAVGTGAVPLAEIWNGSAWTVENNAPSDTSYSIFGASCASALDCVVVGSDSVSDSVANTLMLNEMNFTISPSSGPKGTSLTASGSTFASGETVKVVYFPSSTSKANVKVCTARAQSDGSFSCTGDLPTTKSGYNGKHEIEAIGQTSKLSVEETFTLTKS